jgi:arginyl-tRNA--protein-N-Asp/Glu arginylyltransferase
LELPTFMSPPGPCGYLPEQTWELEYQFVETCSSQFLQERLENGWRHLGHMFFHPRCPVCTACQSLRVVVSSFQSNRSQRRVRQLNDGSIALRIGHPSVSKEKLDLYDRYHTFQTAEKGWPERFAQDSEGYASSHVENPLPTEEWAYYLGDTLLGVGYVTAVPTGLSAVHFFYDPKERRRSLGIWNVLKIIEEASRRGLPYAYLGYYVAGSPSTQYKTSFVPNEVQEAGHWRTFRQS